MEPIAPPTPTIRYLTKRSVPFTLPTGGCTRAPFQRTHMCSRSFLEAEVGGTLQTDPYQENPLFFVGVICPRRAVKGELQHPAKLCQAREWESTKRSGCSYGRS